MKTDKLIGAALDWAVAKCNHNYGCVLRNEVRVWLEIRQREGVFKYSTNWAEAGPIIESEKIRLNYSNHFQNWDADYPARIHEYICESGESPLVAAMRCYVASKFGDEVEIPEDLI